MISRGLIRSRAPGWFLACQMWDCLGFGMDLRDKMLRVREAGAKIVYLKGHVP